jgi:hypothetical protein
VWRSQSNLIDCSRSSDPNSVVSLDLIRVDENGYRLALSFQTTTERRDPVVPTVLEESQTLLDAVDSLLGMILPPNRYGDLDDPLGSVLFWPPDPSRLLEHPMVGPWMRLAAALTATEFIDGSRAVQMGSPLEQQALRCTVD